MADLRPLDFGEILDGSLVIYRRHFGLFLKLAVIALAAPVVLTVYFMLRLQTDLQQNPVRTLLVLVPVVLLYYVASMLLTAGTIRIISDSYLGRTPRLQDALSLGVSKIWSLTVVGLGKFVVLLLIVFGAAMLAGLGAAMFKGAGALLIIAIVGVGLWFTIYVACGYAVTTPIVVLEELGSAFDAFGRSWELSRGSKLKILGLATVVFLLCNIIPSQVMQAVAGAFMTRSPAVGIGLTAGSFVLPLILAPVVASVITLIYYDLRVRREAFDLQILSQQLGII